MRYGTGCAYLWAAVPQPRLARSLHQILMTIAVVCGMSLVPVRASAGPFREIVVFGDSLSDTGNVFTITEPVLEDAIPVSPPYFRGRFSNGPVWVEIVAAMLDLKLSPCLKGGTDFAFGGAETRLDKQELFEHDIAALIPSIRTHISTFLVRYLFDKAGPTALYIVWGGANDLRAALATTTDLLAEAQVVVDNLVAAIEDLADAGAVYVLVPNMPDLGRFPESKMRGPEAVARATALSFAFNNALATALDALEAERSITISRLDTFAHLEEIIADPAAFGLTNVTDACLAGDPFTGGTPCTQTETYLFWDSIHPTAAAHALLAEFAFAALPPMLVTRGDKSSDPSIVEAFASLLPFSPRELPGRQLALDR